MIGKELALNIVHAHIKLNASIKMLEELKVELRPKDPSKKPMYLNLEVRGFKEKLTMVKPELALPIIESVIAGHREELKALEVISRDQLNQKKSSIN